MGELDKPEPGNAKLGQTEITIWLAPEYFTPSVIIVKQKKGKTDN